MSATMGHVQHSDIFFDIKANGKAITGLFCGICYLHSEPYLGPQGNSTRRQIIMKYEVEDGSYDIQFISLNFLKRKYS